MRQNFPDQSRCVDRSGPRRPRARMTACAAAVLWIVLAIAGGAEASAQANITFRSGVTGLFNDEGGFDWGTNLGLVAKFNVTQLFRIRSQVDLDRVGMKHIVLGSYAGPQTATFTSIGFGGEMEVGGSTLDVVAQVTPLMVIRTSTRIVPDGLGGEKIWDITRFSLGATMGLGGEWFITDNIGLEVQGQYVLFNFDHDQTDPLYTGMRLDLGVQFYLGKTFDK